MPTSTTESDSPAPDDVFALSRIPLETLPDDVAQIVAEAGAKQVNLYRALAHAPDLLRAWIEFAWKLRLHDKTPRRLRELMILRTAQLHRSEYEWHQHVRMAREAGVTDADMELLSAWQVTDAFGPAERAALALTDAIVAGSVPRAVSDEIDRHFDYAQRIELTVTAAFYSMVPRILNALGVPIEDGQPEANDGSRPDP